MNHLIKLFILITLFSFYKIDAQYVVKKETISGTDITFTMDSRVNESLEKIEDKCDNSTNEKEAPKVFVANRELTNAEVCRNNPKIMGFKIQVITVKSNEEANKISSDFRNNFRYMKVEKDASLRPNYKILAGSYFSKQSAASDLRSVKSVYPTATVVPYAVFCTDAK